MNELKDFIKGFISSVILGLLIILGIGISLFLLVFGIKLTLLLFSWLGSL